MRVVPGGDCSRLAADRKLEVSPPLPSCTVDPEVIWRRLSRPSPSCTIEIVTPIAALLTWSITSFRETMSVPAVSTPIVAPPPSMSFIASRKFPVPSDSVIVPAAPIVS